MNEDDDVLQCCPDCGDSMDWQDCDVCGGEGEYDAYELDPLLHYPGDTAPCHQCGGLGGWDMCTNKQCKEPTP